MFISEIEITHFRNYKQQKTQFEPNINVITGKNGAGKTNLVEAIHYLSLARSFRNAEDSDLVMKGNDFGIIKAQINEKERKQQITVMLNKEGKRILINGKPITKLSELSEKVNVIVFEPRDAFLFNDAPRIRRKFLDTALSKQSNMYLELMNRYEAFLNERNELLKNTLIDKMQLETITELLIQSSQQIVEYRVEYIKKLNKIINSVIKEIKESPFEVKIKYEPFVSSGTNFKERAIKAFKQAQDNDIRRKTTTIGPHREDFVVEVKKGKIATFGSQGEKRIAAIALKISPYFLIEDEDKKPITILDDVLSELDRKTREKLMKYLDWLGQVFVTTTIPNHEIGTIYDINCGTITRRNTHG
jgi:DNA replication and repair protein RecF